MWDVFRFAWFAVRTFFGVCLLILGLYAALWAFVKFHSAIAPKEDPDAALKRVVLYNARGANRDGRQAVAVSPILDAGASSLPFAAPGARSPSRAADDVQRPQYARKPALESAAETSR